MTTFAEKIKETRTKINSGPENVVLARLDALNAVELVIEAVSSNGIANVISTDQQSVSATLPEILTQQAQIRATCQGAQTSDVQTIGTFSSDTIYDTSSVNFTFPVSNTTVTSFGIQVLSPDGETVINLSSDSSATQTITNNDGTTNTFSTYYDNYYFVQSRKTGSLIRTTDTTELNAILLPNVQKPLGPNTTFGITSERDTWNEFYATMNFKAPLSSDIHPGFSFNSDTNLLTIQTERPLANGSEDSFIKPVLYDPLILKRKFDDGGESAHTQAFVAIVVCEGLHINTDWLPVGDNNGSYAAASAATTRAVVPLLDSSFEDRLDLFHNTSLSTNTNPVFKSLANNLISTGQEIPLFSDTYPNKTALPLFPYVTNKADLQPTGLGERDIFCGRFVLIEKDRKTAAGAADNEYRFVTDTAAQFFGLVNPLLTLDSNGTYSTQSVPNTADPQVTYVESIATVIDSLTGFSHNSGTHPLTVSRNLFTSISGGYAAANTYGTFTPPASGSNTHNGVTASERKLYIKHDGQITDAAGAQQTITASGATGQTVATHYYYILEANDQFTFNGLRYTKYTVTYTYTTGGSGASGDPRFSTLSRSVSSTHEAAPNLYNQVNEWRQSTQGQRVENTYSNIYSLRDNRDPYFESAYDASYSGSNTAQIKYNNFYSRITDVDSKRSAWVTAHLDHKVQAVNASASSNATTGDLDYNGSGEVFPVEFTNYKNAADTFEASRTERITTINARVGVPTYTNQSPAPQDASGTKAAQTVTQIPTVTTSISDADTQVVGVTPYGRKVYDMVNILLDGDVGLIRDALEKINSIQSAFDQIKQDRNIYETLNNRSKQF